MELTGINFIKAFVDDTEMYRVKRRLCSLEELIKEKETHDHPKRKYKEVINKEIIVSLIPDKKQSVKQSFIG